MSKRDGIRTKQSEILDYWSTYATKQRINVSWKDAQTHCWRCACKRNLQRCHIVPASLGGKDEPSNYVLLCQACHAEGPNVTDPDVMWDWISAYDAPFDGAFWVLRGLEEYQHIYHHSFEQDVNDMLTCANVPELTIEEIKRRYFEAMQQSSIHFGQTYPNSATIAGTFRIFLKSIAKEYGINVPAERTGANWVISVFQ